MNPRRGFIALTAVLMSTFVLTVLAVASMQTAFSVRSLIDAYEHRHMADIDARECGGAALFIVEESDSYSFSEQGNSVWLTTDTFCRIDSIQQVGNEVLIHTSASIGGAGARIELTAEQKPDGTFQVLSEKEL